MGPIKKYTMYNRFPWKMMVHIFLLVFVTTLIILQIDTSGSYSRSELGIFYRMFIDSEIDISKSTFDTFKFFYDIDDLKKFVNDCITSYFQIEESTALERYSIPRVYNETSGKEEPMPVSLDVFYK